MCAKLPSLGLERETLDSVELAVSSRSDSERDSEGSTRAKQRRRRLSSENGDLLNIAEKKVFVPENEREREILGWSTTLKRKEKEKDAERRNEESEVKEKEMQRERERRGGDIETKRREERL
jgi:hypothetical protein